MIVCFPANNHCVEKIDACVAPLHPPSSYMGTQQAAARLSVTGFSAKKVDALMSLTRKVLSSSAESDADRGKRAAADFVSLDEYIKVFLLSIRYLESKNHFSCCISHTHSNEQLILEEKIVTHSRDGYRVLLASKSNGDLRNELSSKVMFVCDFELQFHVPPMPASCNSYIWMSSH